MSAKEMYDYLPVAAADVDATLSTPKPQGILTEIGSKNQMLFGSDDGDEDAITLLDRVIFHVRLRWDALTESEAGAIIDLYYSSANARAKSIKWEHPTDGHTYVIKFVGPMARSIQSSNLHKISEISLKVLGRIKDADDVEEVTFDGEPATIGGEVLVW